MNLTMKNITQATVATVMGATAFIADAPSTFDNFANGKFSIVTSEASASGRPGTGQQNPNNTTSNSSPTTTVPSTRTGGSPTGSCPSGCPKTPEKPSGGGGEEQIKQPKCTISNHTNPDYAAKVQFTEHGTKYTTLRHVPGNSKRDFKILVEQFTDLGGYKDKTKDECQKTANQLKVTKSTITRKNAPKPKHGGVYVAPKPGYNTTVLSTGACTGHAVFKQIENELRKGTLKSEAIVRDEIRDAAKKYGNYTYPVTEEQMDALKAEDCASFAVSFKTNAVCLYDTVNGSADPIRDAKNGGQCSVKQEIVTEAQTETKVETKVEVQPETKPVETTKKDIGCTYDFAEQGEQYRYNNSDEPITFNKGDVTEIVCGQTTYYATSNGVSKIFLENAFQTDDKAAVGARFTREMPKENLKVCATAAPELKMCAIK